MLNKKLKIFSALAVISLFGLTGCDEVVAKPSGYSDQIISNVDDKEVYNNLISIVYDGIREGSLSSNVLDKVLYQYSVSIFGPYDKYVSGYKDGDATLFDLVSSYRSDANSARSSLSDFIKDHKAYWNTNDDGERTNDNGDVVDDDSAASDMEINRLLAKFDNIEKRASQAMYKEISDSTYADRSVFKEEKYLRKLRNSLKSVEKVTSATDLTKTLLYPEIEDYQVFDTVSVRGNDVTILHKSYYWGAYATSADNVNTYVEDEIIKDIYREMLVEQYLLDEQYSALGHSYAREVNIVSIKSNSEYPLAAGYLVNQFVDDYILAKPNQASVAESTNKVTLDSFKILSNAWKGAELTSTDPSYTLLSRAGLQLDDGGTYFLATDYGKLMDDYSKINNNPKLTDSSVESEFTGSNSYPVSVGLEMKTNDIILTDYTETGWYVKSGSGLSSLPEKVRSRLFNVGVANALSESEAKEVEQDRYQYSEGDWTYAKDDKESPYVALINGSYYLKCESTESGDPNRDMVFYDRDTTTYYIIQIKEAASSKKLSKINEEAYTKTREDDAEDLITNICEEVATNDTYNTLSTKYWLEKSEIIYHDQEVYDYFKNNYPELFE